MALTTSFGVPGSSNPVMLGSVLMALASEGKVKAAPAREGGFNLVGNGIPVGGRGQVVADLDAEILGRDGGRGPRDVENVRKSVWIAVKDDSGGLAPVHRRP